jgi:hypothetical protein
MAESKLFESGNFIVTTERFVYGTKVVHLEDIDGGAMPFVDRGYLGTAVIGGIGLLMLVFGGVGFKFFGLLVLVGAYFFFSSTIDRSLVMSVSSGEGLHIKVATTDLLYELSGAINNAIREMKSARAGALRDELSNLPRA